MKKPSFAFAERRPLQDHCGVIAAFAPSDIAFFPIGLRGLEKLQTRGYDGAGVCAFDTEGTVSQHKGIGMVHEVFDPEVTARLAAIHAQMWVYQVRYGTSGSFDAENVQPLVGTHKLTGERFIVAHNGQFSADHTSQAMSVSDTVLFTQALASASGSSWDERIQATLAGKRGAWSLAIATPNALFLARDSYGFRPLVYGHLIDPVTNAPYWVVASETTALAAMGVHDFFEVLPGTLAKITTDGLTILERTRTAHTALCIFENVYLDSGKSKAHLPRVNQREINTSPSVSAVRQRSGEILAREAPLTRDQADIVIGVPGTGIEGGKGYAQALGLPYAQAIQDKATELAEQRTFMTAKIDAIYQKVLEHFNFDEEAFHGKHVVLVDDSIVRGNITKGLVYLLKHLYGARSVHLRILSPPIDKACHLGINTRSKEELIVAQCDGDIETVRNVLGAESLAYLSASGLKEAMTEDHHARGFCMGCMKGHAPPIDAFGDPRVPMPTDARVYLSEVV